MLPLAVAAPGCKKLMEKWKLGKKNAPEAAVEPAGDAGSETAAEPTRDIGENVTVVARPITNTTTGLQMHKWVVTDDPERIIAAMERHRDGEALDAASREQVVRNGMRIVRIDQDALDALLKDLGTTAFNASAWHGEAYEWRSVHERATGQGRAIAVDGRIRRFGSGTFRLLLRSWTVQMEDGPVLSLDLAGAYKRSGPANVPIIGGAARTQGDLVPGLGVSMRLDDQYAYVLTGDAPDRPWDGSAPAPARPAADDGARPSAEVGPEAVSPLTFGEMLFRTEGTVPTRTILVFVPRIAAELFPQEESSEATSAADVDGSDSDPSG